MTNDEPDPNRIERLEGIVSKQQQQLQEMRAALASELEIDIGRRAALQSAGVLGASALAAGVGFGVGRTRAADENSGDVGAPGSSQDIWLDQIYDDGGDLVADLDDTGDIDWHGRGFDNVGSVDTGSASVNSNELYIQGSAPGSPSTGDIWIDNDG